MTGVENIFISAWSQTVFASGYLQFAIPILVTGFLAVDYKMHRDLDESSSNVTPRQYIFSLVTAFLSPGVPQYWHSSSRRAVTIISVHLSLLLYQYYAPASIASLFLLVLRTWSLLDTSNIIKKRIPEDEVTRDSYTPAGSFMSFSIMVVIIFLSTAFIRDKGFILRVDNDIFVAFLQVIAILFGFLVVMSFYYIERQGNLRERYGNHPAVQTQINSTNRLFSLTFLVFIIGMILAIVGMLLNSQEIDQSKTDASFRGLPMLFFFLDSYFVITGVINVYSLWSSYRKL
jgi:uncharacterized membrane protein